jgi:DNA-binding LacI/PurR family transcriptional regulator
MGNAANLVDALGGVTLSCERSQQIHHLFTPDNRYFRFQPAPAGLNPSMPTKHLHRPKAPTLKDVAARSAVSYQTVSRVVNGSLHVNPATRARVIEAMEALRYRPNNAARHLVSRQSRIIGCVSSITFYGPARIMVSVEMTAKKHGYNVMFSELSEVNLEEVRRSIDELCDRQVDGIVFLIPLQLEMDFIRTICQHVPFIAIDVDLGPRLPIVMVDQARGARLAIEHVTKLGHRKIAFICGPSQWRAAKLRTHGWMKGLKRANLSPGPMFEGDWSAKSGYLAALELVRHHRGNFTALVSANDHMALGALSAFHENGIEVPDEISVIGYDGMPESEFYQPSLTTIYQDFAALGEMSVEFLLRMINQPGTSPPRFILRPVLVPRKSTAPQNHEKRNKPRIDANGRE